MGCVKCGEVGCDECNDTGQIDIVDCPMEIITNDVWEIIEYAELYKKGLPPVAGGALDQAYSFIQACRYIFSIENYVKRKLGIINGET